MATALTPAEHRLRLGGRLFLITLTVFFIAGMVLYLLLVTWRREQAIAQLLPPMFLVSTVLLKVASIALSFALKSVRRERRRPLILSLLVATVGGLAFMCLQGWAMKTLIDEGLLTHGTQGLWGIVLTLAVLHAIHVAGGMIGLVIVTVGAVLHRYDHESHWPIRFIGTYWNFLDLVWLCMLATFWLTSGGFAMA